MRTSLKQVRLKAWREARSAQDVAFREWMDANAAMLATLPKAAQSMMKREVWASLSPPKARKPGAPRSAGREARKAQWHEARQVALAEVMEELRQSLPSHARARVKD